MVHGVALNITVSYHLTLTIMKIYITLLVLLLAVAVSLALYKTGATIGLLCVTVACIIMLVARIAQYKTMKKEH